MKDINKLIEVLVLEDNHGDFLLVEDYLLEKFKKISISHYTAFSEFKKSDSINKKYSIILLDLVLYDFQKEELLNQVRTLSPNTPIIILTGYTDIDLARELLSKGVSDYLLKDEINPEILYKTIVFAIERESFIQGINSSKLQYQNLFNFSPQPMWIFNTDNLKFLDVNRAAIDKYGYSKEEFLAKTIYDIRPVDHQIYLEKSLKLRSQKKESVSAGIFTHSIKSGELIQVEIFSRNIEYDEQNACFIIANDITDNLKHLALIETQNARLKEIAWKQSHVVRAPLSRIMGIVSLINQNSEGTEDLNFLLEQINVSAKELDKIIGEIVSQTQSLDINN